MSFLTGRPTQAQQTPAISGLQIQSSVLGKPIPIIYGATRVAGNLIWYGGFQQLSGAQQTGKGGGGGGGKGGGKGGGSQTNYQASVAIALCEGPVAGYGHLWNNKNVSHVNATFTEFFGNYPQTPWTYLTTNDPAQALGYAGVGYVAAANLQLGAGAQLPNFNFEVQGALFGTGNNQAGFGDADPSQVVADLLTNSFYGAGFPAARLGTLNTVLQEAHVVPATGPLVVTVAEAPFFKANLDVVSGGTTLSCVAGSPAAGQYSFSAGVYTFNAAQAGSTVRISYAWLGGLTNYQAYALASGLWISPAYTDQAQVSSMLDDIATYTNSEWVWSSGVLTLVPRGTVAIGGNGFSYAPPAAPLFNLTDDDFLPNVGGGGASAAANGDPVLLTRLRPADQLNDIKIECLDRANQYNIAIVEASDQAMIDNFGRRSDQSRQAHLFCDLNAANTSAQLLLQRQAIRNTYQFTLDQRYCVLDPMDIVTLTDAGLGLNQQPVRITEITENDDGTLSIVAEEYPAGLGAPPTYSFQTGQRFAANYNLSAGNINPPIIFEPPAALAEDLEIWLSVSGQPGIYGGADVYISGDGDTYQFLGRLLGPTRMGALAAPLPAVAAATTGPTLDQTSTLSVNLSESGGQLFSVTPQAAASGNSLCYVDGELIAFANATLTGANQYSLTSLVRGMYGSPIGSHGVGSAFARLDGQFFRVPFTADRIGQVVYFKFLTFNQYGGGEQSLASAQPYAYAIQGTAFASPLAAPSNLVAVYVANQTSITWSEIGGDFRPILYEIRSGASFQGGQVLGTLAHPPFVVPGNGTYWVAAVTRPIAGIQVYSAWQSITVSGAVIATNTVQSFNEGATGWSGSFGGNATLSGGVVVLDYQGNVLGVADWLNDLDILHMPPAGPAGTYTIPASHRVNVGRVAPCTVSIALTSIGQVPGQSVLSITNWLANTDILGNAASANVNVVPYIQTAGANGVFGPFQKFVPGVYNAQFFNIQVQLSSTDSQTQAILESLVFSISIPDRIDDYVGVTVPAAGLNLVYFVNGATSATPAPFNSGPGGQALPQIQVTVIGEQAGDIVSLTNQTLAGATVQILNGGAGVQRVANILVKGF